jgi:hypothetical protein
MDIRKMFAYSSAAGESERVAEGGYPHVGNAKIACNAKEPIRQTSRQEY